MSDQQQAILLEDLTWIEAEQVLTPTTLVVIPLGAAAKEHGPHLKLKNDWVLAKYFKRRVLATADVAIAPTLATRAKGKQVVEAIVTGMLRDIEVLRNTWPESITTDNRE